MVPAHCGILARSLSSAAAFLLDFTSGTLPSGVTAGGGTNGTSISSSGLVVNQAAPRFARNVAIPYAAIGLLVEPANTNVLSNGSNIGTSWATNGTVGPNNGNADPYGNNTATALQLNGLNNGYYQFINYPSSGTVEMSIKLKRATSPGLSFRYGSDNSGNYVTIDAYTMATTVTGDCTNVTVTQAENGFYKLAFYTVTNGNNSIIIYSSTSNAGSVILADAMVVAAQNTLCSFIQNLSGSLNTRSADAISFAVPSGISTLTYKFDDGSTQAVSVTSGSYTIPTTLSRSIIATITGS